jgi:Tfp pilus assembly ATPase PilU
MMAQMPKKPLIAIVGATGTGKSDVGYTQLFPFKETNQTGSWLLT